MLQGQKKSIHDNEALGRSRGGWSTKVHVAVADTGQPLRVLLTGGEAHDITKAEELVSQHSAERIIADKAYDSDDFVETVHNRGAKAVIPPRSTRLEQRRYSKKLYRQRNKVERFINRVKNFRRAATRYEKTARNFLSIWMVAAVVVMLRANVNTA